MVIPIGFAQINYVLTGSALPYGAEVVFGVDNAGALSASAIAASVGNCFSTGAIDARLCSSVKLSECRAKLGPNNTGAMAVATFNLPGLQVASAITPGVSVMAEKVTALGGRKGRGRMFWPGASDTAFDDNGALTGANVTAWNASLANFLGDLTTIGLPMVLLHGDATTPTPVTALTVDGRAASQRRRQRR